MKSNRIHKCLQILGFFGLAISSLESKAATLNHFAPHSGNESYLVTASPSVLPHLQSNVWLMSTYASNPLVYRDASGKIIRRAVADQLHLELGSSFGLADVVQLGIALPFGYVGGEGIDGQGLSTLSLADARIMGKLRLTPWSEGFIAGFRTVATLPFSQASTTGSSLVGEKLPTFTAAATAGFQDGGLRAGFDVGAVLRNPTPLGTSTAADFEAQQVGHEIIWGLGSEIPLSGDISILTDIYGRFTPTSLNSSVPQMPTEISLGLRGWINDVQLTAGVGSGLVAGFGTPSGRVFVNATFLAQRPQRPRLYDNAAEAFQKISAWMGASATDENKNAASAPNAASPKETKLPAEKTNSDADESSDAESVWLGDDSEMESEERSMDDDEEEGDESPTKELSVEDERSLRERCAALEATDEPAAVLPAALSSSRSQTAVQTVDVCAGPEASQHPHCNVYQPDRDRDGIPDSLDRCRAHPEDFDGWQDNDGCPDWDNDGDRILDTLDACPNDPENVDGYLDEDGCPDNKDGQNIVIQFRKDHISYQPQRLFRSGRSTLSKTAELVLEQLAQKLEKHKEVGRVRIIGLPDNIRNTPTNRQLAGKRAGEVRNFLVSKGIAPSRLLTSNVLEEDEDFMRGRELSREQVLLQIETAKAR